MKRIKNKLLKISMFILLFVGSIFLLNCEKEELIQTELNSIETLSIEESLSYLNDYSENKKTGQKSNDNHDFLKAINLKKIKHEKLNNSEEKLIVIPAIIHEKDIYSRVLMLKIDNQIRTVIFSMTSDTGNDNYSGRAYISDFSGNFLKGYVFENGVITKKLVKNKSDNSNEELSLNRDPCGTDCPYTDCTLCELDEVVIDATEKYESNHISVPFIFGIGNTNDYETNNNQQDNGNENITWESNGTDNDNSDLEEEEGPSCESFNFQSVGSNWQESAVIGINFNIFLLDDTGISYKYTVLCSQPTLFGVPKNLSNGGDLFSNIAADISARVLNKAMSLTARRYYNKHVMSSVVDSYFKQIVREEYPKYIPGGRVMFNASSFSVIPSQYKTNSSSSGCN